MECELKIEFKKQIFTEFQLAIMEKAIPNFSGRFNADFFNSAIVLPLLDNIHGWKEPEDEKELFKWFVESMGHESLHLIVKELENAQTSFKLDNLGYNLATGYEDERIVASQSQNVTNLEKDRENMNKSEKKQELGPEFDFDKFDSWIQ